MDEKKSVPAIRFKGFTDSWEQRKLGTIIKLNGRIGFRGYTEKDIVSKEKGGVLTFSPTNIVENKLTLDCKNTYITRFKFDESPEIKIHNGDILFVKTGSTLGKSALVTGLFEDATLNPQVVVIRAHETYNAFIAVMLTTNHITSQVNSSKIGGAVPTLTETRIKDFNADIPVSEIEREQIGRFFTKINNLITLHQRKLESLKKMKKALLEKMFPRDGENMPSIRFKGFTDSWEQRKLGDSVKIERGGSPRPIEAFITTEQNGLNWVKIGDAPTMGNVITKTAEKIKPEGLSKTRQVYPGDLILSNSMSFGKPYIMGINGCIHDGWLLIRDEHNNYNQTFLCFLLGSENMLKKYRALAAGSTVNNLNKDLVESTTVTAPQKKEQTLIGEYFRKLDDLITLHQRKLEKLKNIKKVMLEKMFV